MPYRSMLTIGLRLVDPIFMYNFFLLIGHDVLLDIVKYDTGAAKLFQTLGFLFLESRWDYHSVLSFMYRSNNLH